MRLIRDRVDDVLLWPAELRAAEFAAMAKSCQLDDRTFRKLAAAYAAVSSFVTLARLQDAHRDRGIDGSGKERKQRC